MKIFIFTHIMDEKWIFLLNVNRDTNEYLCRHLVEIEKPSPPPGPPPLQSSISRQAWERAPMAAPRIKGCRLKYVIMEHKSTIVSFLSLVLLLQ